MLKQFRRHAARLKWNPVVAVTLIEPPIFVKQPAFVLQPFVKRRSGKRREMIKRRDVERVFPCKRDGLGLRERTDTGKERHGEIKQL